MAHEVTQELIDATRATIALEPGEDYCTTCEGVKSVPVNAPNENGEFVGACMAKHARVLVSCPDCNGTGKLVVV